MRDEGGVATASSFGRSPTGHAAAQPACQATATNTLPVTIHSSSAKSNPTSHISRQSGNCTPKAHSRSTCQAEATSTPTRVHICTRTHSRSTC